jgi:CubicO group peptidase (beta-lactamase class C family)
MRTMDMARLGQLHLQKGRWEDRQLVPEDFVQAATHAQNAGGAPVGLSYGLSWWVVPSRGERQTFMGAGFGGQFIWVHEPRQLVIAVNSTPSLDSHRRGQAMQLIRTRIFAAVAGQRPAAP